MTMGGWKTAAMFRRYAIVNPRDTAQGIAKLEQHRAENGHDFGHDSAFLAPSEAETRTGKLN